MPGSILYAVAFMSAAGLATLYVLRHRLEAIYYSRVHGRKAFTDYAQLTGVPHPTPLPDFDVDKAKARPYRPFRWEYHQTMSLSKMDPDWWVELESNYRKRIVQRKQLHEAHGKSILDCTPGSEAACRELMEMVIQFLCMRYPNQFQFDWRTGMVVNQILKTQYDVDKVEPLTFLLDNVPEDFLITQKDEKTGLYHLRAGVCCSAVGWSLGIKMGMPLHEIHGPVPDYKEKMQMSMDRYFSKMPTDKPIQRGSWGLEVGEPIFLQGHEEEFVKRAEQNPDLDISDINLRVDHQTLRRLPVSRGIVFNFKPLFTPFMDFREEPFIPELLLKVLTEGKKSIMDYKGTVGVEHKVLPTLKEWAEEQRRKGWVPGDWKVRTLEEHPFFPGWRD